MNGLTKLAAFRVERRSIAAAVFLGTKLDYAHVKQLSAVHEKAEASTIGFVNWLISSFDITSAAIERFENGQEMLRAQLDHAIEHTLRASGASVHKVGKSEILESFGQPPLKTRTELRKAITTIWPILDSKQVSGTKLDAVALGLYVQTDRLFQY